MLSSFFPSWVQVGMSSTLWQSYEVQVPLPFFFIKSINPGLIRGFPDLRLTEKRKIAESCSGIIMVEGSS